MLCRQFSPSSLPRLANGISRCNTCWRQMNSFNVGTLLFSSADDRGRNSRTMAFQLTCGRPSCSVWWSSKNRSAPLQPHMTSRMNRYAASYVISSAQRGQQEAELCVVPGLRRSHCARQVSSHTTSIAQQDGPSTESTWTGDGKRRQRGEPHSVLRGTIDREKGASRVCFLIQERMGHVEYLA
jgi:hypothetical protein